MPRHFCRPSGAALVLGALLVLVVAGCGGPPVGEITGTVTFEGKPMPGGLLSFIPKSGQADQVKTSAIREDGTYSVTGVGTGQAKITVTPPVPTGIPQGGVEPKPLVPLPWRYRTADQTDLTYDVKPGAQTFDIPLKK